MTYENNTKRIFTKKLAIFLRQNGCDIIKTEINRNKPQYDVYVFEDTEKLQRLIAEYNR